MKKSNIFWIGYSDLMTSLFFVMLVLFVVTIGYLKYKIKATEEELKKIQELQIAIQELPKDYFEYQPDYKRFILKEHVQFDKDKSIIKPDYYEYLTKVGISIQQLINALSNNDKLNELDIKYLVVIEGMASMDKSKRNFELSYERALSLYRFWRSRNIVFDPKACEIQISGSGTGGIGRYTGDEEFRNQQILIHIIPKLGQIKKPGESFITIEEEREEVLIKKANYEETIVMENPPASWEAKYDSIGEFGQDNLTIVNKNLKFGLVSKEGKEIVHVIYENISRTETKGLYIVVKDSKIGIINKSGKLITPLKYDGIGEWSEGMAIVISNDKCGYINIKGVEVIPLTYNNCEKFSSGRAKVSSAGQEMYINAQNELLELTE